MINLGNGRYRDIECIDEAFDKAKRYDDMQKPFTHRIYVPKLVKENKQLKQKYDELFIQFDYKHDECVNLKQKLEDIKKFHHEYELVFIGFKLKDDPDTAKLIRFEYKDKFDILKKILRDKDE